MKNSEVMESSGSILVGGVSLSIAQQRLWVLEQLHPGSAAQNVALFMRWKGQIDQAPLEIALDGMVRRHEILRTEFHAVDGAPVQIGRSSAQVTVNGVDLRHLALPEREARLSTMAEQDVGDPFDLAHSPLLRATLFELSDTEASLVMSSPGQQGS
jgi:hypothetical protein